MVKKYFKILITAILVIYVLTTKIVLPIIEEYGAKGNREPLYVRKKYSFEIDKIIRVAKKNNQSVPRELIEKYYLEGMYIYPRIFNTAYGNQIEKSGSGPYSFSIFAITEKEGKEVLIRNISVFEKRFYFFEKKILEVSDEINMKIDNFIVDEYITHHKFTTDLFVSEIYRKPILVRLEVSTEVAGEQVSKSIEYLLEPFVKKGVQKPIWMYQ